MSLLKAAWSITSSTNPMTSRERLRCSLYVDDDTEEAKKIKEMQKNRKNLKFVTLLTE